VTPRQLVALLSLAGIWGASFLYIRVLVDGGFEPTGVSAGRTAIGVLTLLPFAWASRDAFPRDGRTWAALALLGITNFAAPWTLVAVSQEHIPSSVASIVNSAMPLWAAIFSALVVRTERLAGLQVVGLLLGFLGVVALVGADPGDLGGDSTLGIAIMLIATAMYGGSTVAIRRYMSHVTPVALTVGQVGFAAIALAPIALATGAFEGATFGAAEISAVVALGALSSGMAIVLFMWLIREVGPVRASVVTYLMPPIGVFLGWAVFSEPIGWNLVVGLLLIATGVALVQGIVRVPGRVRVAPAQAQPIKE